MDEHEHAIVVELAVFIGLDADVLQLSAPLAPSRTHPGESGPSAQARVSPPRCTQSGDLPSQLSSALGVKPHPESQRSPGPDDQAAAVGAAGAGAFPKRCIWVHRQDSAAK